jgi:RNA polymerase sigma-70 factor (ECF subfamily)
MATFETFGELGRHQSMTLLSDVALVKRAQSGDNSSLEELVRRYERRIHDITARMLGRDEDANEALQETFLRAYRFLPKFEFRSSFYTWLYRIATNVSLTKLRKRNKPPEPRVDVLLDNYGTSSGETAGELGTGETDFRRKDQREAIKRAIDELPSDYKLVLVLRDLEGLSNHEVGQALNLSVPAVKSRLHRGRVLLRARLTAQVQSVRET